MSIWCSREIIGFDDMHEDGRPNHGQVRSYASGWSNHYPTIDGEAEQDAGLSLASIPSWCVPGRSEDEDFERIGPWVRLDVFADKALTWWVEDPADRPAAEPLYASVVLDEEAARLLVDQLNQWLGQPKVYPVRADA